AVPNKISREHIDKARVFLAIANKNRHECFSQLAQGVPADFPILEHERAAHTSLLNVRGLDDRPREPGKARSPLRNSSSRVPGNILICHQSSAQVCVNPFLIAT